MKNLGYSRVALLLALSSMAFMETVALSAPASSKRLKKRVAIIGTGIGGLSVAHALVNSPSLQEEYASLDFQVSMFEARPKLDTKAGAGVQLNGGLVALGRINKKVQRAVIDAGLPLSSIQSRSKPWGSNAKKPFEELLQIDLRKIGEMSNHLIQDDRELLWSAIMRGCLQETLWNTLPRATQRRVKFNKVLTNMHVQAEDGSVICEFSDGTTEGPFDVVVGCDGVKSACKEYIETGKISKDPMNRQGRAAPLYSGIRIQYAVDESWFPTTTKSEGALTQYFGDGANVLVGAYGNGPGRPNSKIAFYVSLDKDYSGPFRKKQAAGKSAKADENVNWREEERRYRDLAQRSITSGMQEYGIPSGEVDPIVKAADRFFEVGVYFHNPFSLAGWSKKVAGKDSAVVALCGDAAHTIPPFLGQGSNQAIQDAYCLARKLYEYNANVVQGVEGPSLDKLLKDYERTRWLHNFIILMNTCFLGYLETGGENGFYAKFRDMFYKTTGLIGIAQRVLLTAADPVM
eukprot:scaffold2482_cov166-Amphora_coffeaeformis.AAC.18